MNILKTLGIMNIVLFVDFFSIFSFKFAWNQILKHNIFYKVKLATVVKGNQKAPFSIATTLRCRGGCYSFPWISPLYPWYIPYIAEF